MKNYLITEDQLEKIVNELENQDDQENDGENSNPLSSLFTKDDNSETLKKIDMSKVSSDDPVIKFFDSLK